MSPAVAGLEVLRFEAIPAGSGVAVVELDGRFTGPAPERPRLLVERFGRATELPAVGVVPEPWSATFAVPLEALTDASTSYALVPGRGPLIALPSPSLAVGGDDRFVRLARTVNDLRHRLTEASAAVQEAERRAAAVASERDMLAREVDEARARMARELGEAREQASRELADVTGRLEDAERRAVQAAGEAEAARAERDAAGVAAAESAEAAHRAAAEADVLQQALEEAELEARAARRELRDTRARLEALQREHGRSPGHRPRRVGDAPGSSLAAPADGEDVATGEHVAQDADRPAHDPVAEHAPAGGDQAPAGDHGHASAGEPLRWDTAEADATAQSGEPTRTLEMAPDDLGPLPPEDDSGESVRVLRPTPRSAAARRSPAVRRPEAHVETGETGETDESDVLGPAAVGARSISPAETRAGTWTQARIVVAVAAALLFIALVAIFLGFGVL